MLRLRRHYVHQTMEFSPDFTQSGSSCFIVKDSQESESQYSQLDHSKMLSRLKALQGPRSTDQGVLYSPRKCDLVSSQNTKKRAAASNGSQDNNPQPGLSGGQNNAGEGNNQEAGGSGGDGGGGGQDPNQGGDGGGNDDNSDDDDGDGEGQEEDNPAEEDTPSSESTNSGSMPPELVPVPAQPGSPAVLIPEHVLEQAMHEGQVSEIEHVGEGQVQGQMLHPVGQGQGSSLESGGGISDAPTAVVSDSDHRFSAPEPMTSPGRASVSSTSPGRAAAPLDVSSAVSTLSSLSSTSPEESRVRVTAPRRKAPLRKQNLPASKKLKLDTSTSTPETSTSSSSRKTTTSDTSVEKLLDTSADTSREKSHDTSGDRSHDRSEGGDISGSQQDMFGDELGGDQKKDEGGGREPGGRQAHTSGSQHQAKADFEVATPAEKLGSLHFSGHCNVAETIEEEADSSVGSDIVPPSQDAFDAAPMIVPSSPTYDAAVEKPRSASSSSAASRPKSVSEWQPSYRSYDNSPNGNSRSDNSRQDLGDPTHLQKTNSATQTELKEIFASAKEGGETSNISETAIGGTSKRSRRARKALDVLDTQDLELPQRAQAKSLAVENSTAGESLHLQMTELETCPSPHLSTHRASSTKISSGSSTREVTQHQPEVVHLSSDSAERFLPKSQALYGDCSGGNWTSQGLALRLSQSQEDAHQSLSQFEDAEEDGNGGFQLSVEHLAKATTTPTVQTKQTQQELSQNVAKTAIIPSLTLDMINTMAEEETQSAVTGFTMDRPDPLQESSAPHVPSPQSVFQKVREMKPASLRESVSSKSGSVPVDPYDFSEGREVHDMIKFQRQYAARKSPKKARESLRKSAGEEWKDDSDSEIVFKTENDPGSYRSSSFYERDTLEEIPVLDKNKVKSKTRDKRDLTDAGVNESDDESNGSARTEGACYLEKVDKQDDIETYETATQEYSYSEDQLKRNTRQSVSASEPRVSTPGMDVDKRQPAVTFPTTSDLDSMNPRIARDSSGLHSQRCSMQDDVTRVRGGGQDPGESKAKSSQRGTSTDDEKAKDMHSTGQGEQKASQPTGKGMEESEKGALPPVHDTPTSIKSKRKLKGGRKILHYTSDVPPEGHVLSPSHSKVTTTKKKRKTRSTRSGNQKQDDPYEFISTQQQQERERRKDLEQRRDVAGTSEAAIQGGISTVDMDTQPIEEDQAGPSRLQESLPLKTSSRLSDVHHSNPSRQASRNPRIAGSEAGKSSEQKRFHTLKMITDFRRTIVLEQEIVGGSVVNTKVLGEKIEQISHRIEDTEEVMSSPSPNRTAQTMTSGDLGDISSISSSNFPSRPGSNHASPALLSRNSSKNYSTGSKESTHSGSGQPVSKRRESLKSKAESSPAVEPNHTSTMPNPEEARISSQHTPSLQAAQKQKSTASDSSMSKKQSSGRTFGSAFSLDLAVEGAKKSSSSVSFEKHSESLFSDATNGNPAGDLGRAISKSSSSVNQSGSLFSKTSSDASHVFVKPSETNIPIASNKRRSSSGSRKSTGLGTSSETIDKTSESDVIPPSEPESSSFLPTRQLNLFMKHASKKQASLSNMEDAGASKMADSGIPVLSRGKDNEQQHEDEDKEDNGDTRINSNGDDVSPEIPVVAYAAKSPSDQPRPSSAVSDGNVESFPPYWPTTEIIVQGTPVLAMWRDKHWYHGHVVSYEKNRYVVDFEDGDRKPVKATEIIVCDLLAVGQDCFAEREDEDGSQEQARIIGHHKKGEMRTCVVKFQDGSTAKLERGKLSLNKEQVNNLVTGVTVAVETDQPLVRTLESRGDSQGRGQTDDATNIASHDGERGEKRAESPEMDLTCIKPKTEARDSPQSYEASAPFLPTTTLQPHTPVYGKWIDKHYYPGYVVEQDSKTGKYLVKFEDGPTRYSKESDLIVCELLKIGQQVFAGDIGAEYAPAEVVGHWRKGQITGYKARFAEGDLVYRVERGKVILREEQANALIEELRPFGTPKPSGADVSLDHLVEGKRSRPVSQRSPQKKQGRVTARSIGKDTSSERKAAQVGAASSGISSTGGKAATKRKLEPKYTSTPTPKRKATPLREMGPTSRLVPHGMVDSPQQTRRSPRKAKLELFSAIKGQIPAQGSSIFHGMAFLLTHVQKTEEQKRRDREILQQNESIDLSATDESFAEDEMQVPFDKEHLQKQIECGGGTVLSHFDCDLGGRYERCVLISSTYQRTLKYIQGLAAGLPCVSHVWIKDCCVAGELKDYKAYLLPAGISIETNSLRECWTRLNPLRSLTMVVSSRDEGFVDTWTSVLDICGCQIVTSIPSRASQNTVYAVVADKTIEADTLARARQLNIPVVSSEWVIQCLVNGQVVDCSKHPRYKHTFELPN